MIKHSSSQDEASQSRPGVPTPDNKLTKLILWLKKAHKEYMEDEVRHGNRY